MEIRFACPETGTELVLTPDWAGKSFVCPHCGDQHPVPAPAPVLAPEVPRRLLCPTCLAEAVVQPGKQRAHCATCDTEFTCLYVRPVKREIVSASKVKCVNHSDNWAVNTCRDCRKRICDLCTFTDGGREYCPTCINGPLSSPEAQGDLTKSVGSVLLSVLALVLMIVLMAAASTATPKEAEAIGSVLGIGVLACSAGGLFLGFGGRESGGATNTWIGTLGIILNALVFGILLLLSLVGTMMG